MFRIWRRYFNLIIKSNKLVSFILGIVVGFIFSILFINNPFDFSLDQWNSDRTLLEPKFDPFANVNLPSNDRIKERIRFYLRADRKAELVKTYVRSGKYLPMIAAIFEEYNLPQSLVFLPVIESNFFPNSRSHAGAVGLWQIMPATALDYGLMVNRWIDERRDPEKSTIVAAEYLRFLYEKFGDWDLALAAYNYGLGKLNRALRRDKTLEYWKLRRIPRETYNFVPKYYAVLHIFANPEKYNIKLPDRSEPIEYDTIELEATFSLQQIARLANVSPKIIKQFNPALTGNIAPSGKYSIKVPSGVKENFLQQYKNNPPDRVEIIYKSYKVRKGDTLFKIAKRFGTTVNAIKADNNLRSSRWINVGMNLRIASVTVTKQSVPDEIKDELATNEAELEDEIANKINLVYKAERDDLSLKTLARYYSVTTEDLKAWNKWLQADDLQEGEEINIYKSIDNITVHKTRRGDSLWKLARRYNTTVSNLQRWNQIGGSKIYPGVSLIVKL